MSPVSSAGFNSEAADRFSQCGEDGIIGALLDRLPDLTGWCVEFGANDGVSMSNTRALVVERGYKAVLIEGDPQFAAKVRDTYADNDSIIPIEAMVGWGADDNLDVILAETPIPETFDVLSIDIDGNDYHVWKAVTRYRPRIVVIEFNPTMDNAVEFVQPEWSKEVSGSSALSMVKLARAKGYELVATTMMNCIFVDRSSFETLGIEDNSLAALRADESMVTHIFTGYDGTVYLAGAQVAIASGAPLVAERMQAVPRVLRGIPWEMGPIRRTALRIWMKLIRIRYRR